MSPADDIAIKPIHLNTAIAFGGSGIVLKSKSLSDLIDLGISARSSNNPELLKLFQELPSLPELKAMKLRMLEKKYFSDANQDNQSTGTKEEGGDEGSQ